MSGIHCLGTVWEDPSSSLSAKKRNMTCTTAYWNQWMAVKIVINVQLWVSGSTWLYSGMWPEIRNLMKSIEVHFTPSPSGEVLARPTHPSKLLTDFWQELLSAHTDQQDQPDLPHVIGTGFTQTHKYTQCLDITIVIHTRDGKQHFPACSKCGDAQLFQVLVCQSEEGLEIDLKRVHVHSQYLHYATSHYTPGFPNWRYYKHFGFYLAHPSFLSKKRILKTPENHPLQKKSSWWSLLYTKSIDFFYNKIPHCNIKYLIPIP